MTRNNHFTLVEILVAIGIMVILASMLLTGLSGVLGKGDNAKAKADMVTLRNAISAFETEYNKLPKPKNDSLGSKANAVYNGAVLNADEYKWLLLTLQGEDLDSGLVKYGKMNPKKKNFLELQGNEAGVMTDPWDKPYKVIFEKRHNKGIDYDTAGQSVPGIGIPDSKKISQPVVIWSMGEDNEETAGSPGKKNNEDNVYSIETVWSETDKGHVITK